MRKLCELVILIKGGGELASAIAHRLHQSHFRVCLTERPHPLAVSRGTTFCEAVFDKTKIIEGVTAELTPCNPEAIEKVWQRGNIPLVIDEKAEIRHALKPDVLVDAISAKRNTGTSINDAPLVIGLGPGFCAGRDAHINVETNHDNNLGKVILKGEPKAFTGLPVSIGGLDVGRVIWADKEGLFKTDYKIGDVVEARQVIAYLGDTPLEAPVGGMIRGLMRDGVTAPKTAKIIEIDPVNEPDVCFSIRDKWRSVAGGVLEAIMMKYNLPC